MRLVPIAEELRVHLRIHIVGPLALRLERFMHQIQRDDNKFESRIGLIKDLGRALDQLPHRAILLLDAVQGKQVA